MTDKPNREKRIRRKCQEMDLDELGVFVSGNLMDAEWAIEEAMTKIDACRDGDNLGEAAHASMETLQAWNMIRAGHMVLTRVDATMNKREIPVAASR